MMSIITGLSIVVLIIQIILIKISENKELLQPARLFGLIINSTFCVTTLRLANYQCNYEIWYFFFIEGMIILFWFGTKIAQAHYSKANNVDQLRYNTKYIKKNMRIIIATFWLFIIISFMVEVLLLGAPPAISMSIRDEYFVSGWGSVVTLIPTLFALLLYDRYCNKAVPTLLFWFYLVTILIICYLLSNKFQFILLLVIWFVGIDTFKHKINMMHLIIMAALTIVLFIVMYYLVYLSMYNVTTESVYYSYGMRIPKWMSILETPYLYVENNFDNLYYFILKSTHRTYGLRTFDGIYSIFGLDQLYPIQIRNNLLEWHNLLREKSLTTGTVFRDFFQDNGFAGTIIFTMFCGYLTEYFYLKFKHQANCFTFIAYSIMNCALFLSFFTNMFTSKISIMNIIASYFIGKIISIRFKLKV